MVIIMDSNKIFLLSFIPFLFSPSIEALVTYLHHNCSSSETFSAESTFQVDRTTLLSTLASVNTEFYNITVVSGGDSGTVYGLYMCRGDIVNNPNLCHQCVVKATQRLSSECRASKEAIIWYDECMIRYSNSSFFSTINTRPRLSLLTTGNVSNQARFMRTLYDVLNKTANESAKPATGKKKYATGTANFSRFQTVYCVAQCTPDLTPSDCRSCLSGVIGDLEWCCNGKQGGRVLYPSCNVRYELYPFYQSEVSPTNITGSQDAGKRGISSKTIVAVVVPISVTALVFIVDLRCSIKRISRNNDISNLDSVQYELTTIKAATNMFSSRNKLGVGEYGQVYKGMLPNGQEIAVKRLSRGSKKSVEQFKNEVEMLAKLQHKNLAKILLIDQTEGNADRIVGTYGYMAPEYIMHGVYSIKSDVYSFGILLMETISGRRIYQSFHQINGVDGLLSYAWKLWNDEKPLEFLDPTIRESCTPNEVIRCIHIGLLCVQENPIDRPSISSILLMLECYPMTLPTPSQPRPSDSTPMSVNEMSISEEMANLEVGKYSDIPSKNMF
ncbi:hypothetical protein K1719_043959 [Acacia pycnantha]|nr:hypothetical protein K1719_043959 [Acacia pycnantha]